MTNEGTTWEESPIKKILEDNNKEYLGKAFEVLKGQLQSRRRLLGDEIQLNHDIGEFCYHLISVLIESKKVVMDEGFSSGYIEEHTFILSRLAKSIGKDSGREFDVEQ